MWCVIEGPVLEAEAEGSVAGMGDARGELLGRFWIRAAGVVSRPGGLPAAVMASVQLAVGEALARRRG